MASIHAQTSIQESDNRLTVETMHATSIRQFSSPRPKRSVAAWVILLARLLLALVLMADQIGSPLHNHHHDAGVNGTWSGATLGHGSELDAYADHEDASEHFSHATLAVRSVSAFVRVAPGVDSPSDIQLFTELLALQASAEDPSLSPCPGWRPPYITAYRSLPPAGRAPPLHV